MTTFQCENLEAGLEEIKALLPLHYEELALNKDKVPLSPMYDVYIAREQAGQLIYFTARDEGKLVGYFLGFIAPGLHYSTCLTCTMDIFFVHPDVRGTAMLGLKMFRKLEEELKLRGVDRWFVGSKARADASALFERLDFEKVEVYYSKWIGE